MGNECSLCHAWKGRLVWIHSSTNPPLWNRGSAHTPHACHMGHTLQVDSKPILDLPDAHSVTGIDVYPVARRRFLDPVFLIVTNRINCIVSLPVTTG